MELEEKFKIKTIPKDFYGGADPVIKFKKTEKQVEFKKEKPIVPDRQFVKATKPPMVPDKKKSAVASRKFLVIFAIIIFFAVCAVLGFYYWWKYKQVGETVTIPREEETLGGAVQTSTAGAENLPSSTATSTTSTASEEEQVEVPNTFIEYPSLLIGYGDDFDGDELSDFEEEIFSSDPTVVDTDKDGYADGHEVSYLYNPVGVEPRNLIDSGKVIDYVNPVYGYKMYYPADWVVGSLNLDGDMVLFSALNGENIEVRTVDIVAGETFEDWFSRWGKNESLSRLRDFTGVYNEQGLRRDDGLVYYFVDHVQRKVIIILYHVSDLPVANYRMILNMMAKSFRLEGNTFIKEWPEAEGMSEMNSVSTSTP